MRAERRRAISSPFNARRDYVMETKSTHILIGPGNSRAWHTHQLSHSPVFNLEGKMIRYLSYENRILYAVFHSRNHHYARKHFCTVFRLCNVQEYVMSIVQELFRENQR